MKLIQCQLVSPSISEVVAISLKERSSKPVVYFHSVPSTYSEIKHSIRAAVEVSIMKSNLFFLDS